MRSFRLLNADEIECRISEINKGGKFLNLLLYKTARTDAALLDETFGPFEWQCDYKVIDGKMYCGIGVNKGDEWVWKWNCGTESNTEAEKGQASDALKRAGFVWGLGTELYSSPRITVFPDKCDMKEIGGKWRCYDSFSVKLIEYDEKQNIKSLIIFNDSKRCVAFKWGMANDTPQEEKPPTEGCKSKKSEDDVPAPQADGYWVCEKCKKPVTRVQGNGGAFIPPKEVVKISYKRTGHVFCADCVKSYVET